MSSPKGLELPYTISLKGTSNWVPDVSKGTVIVLACVTTVWVVIRLVAPILEVLALSKYKFGFLAYAPVSANGFIPCLFKWPPPATTPAWANVDKGVYAYSFNNLGAWKVPPCTGAAVADNTFCLAVNSVR